MKVKNNMEMISMEEIMEVRSEIVIEHKIERIYWSLNSPDINPILEHILI